MAVVERIFVESLFRKSLLKDLDKGSSVYQALEIMDSLDVVQLVKDDFTGRTLDTGDYTLSNGGGNAAADPVITAGVVNGVADFVTGDAAGSTASSELAVGLQAKGDQGCFMIVRVTSDIVTNMKMEFGFTDALTDPGAIATKSTPGFNAADCAIWVFDTDDDVGFEGLANNNTDTAPMTTLEAGITPVAGTYEWFGVELIETDDTNSECAVVFYRWDADGNLTFKEIGGGVGGNQGPNGNILLTPWVYVEERSGGATTTMSVDFLGAWQRRTAG